MSSYRSTQAAGGAAAHGGSAQSGDGKEERDAAQVFTLRSIIFTFCYLMYGSYPQALCPLKKVKKKYIFISNIPL